MYNISRKPRESALVSGVQVSTSAHDLVGEQYLAEDRVRMCAVVRQTSKTCLAFKILAASRNCATQHDVQAAFDYAFGHIKAQDAVVVGIYPRDVDQVTLNVQHALQAIAKVK